VGTAVIIGFMVVDIVVNWWGQNYYMAFIVQLACFVFLDLASWQDHFDQLSVNLIGQIMASVGQKRVL
jgi:hypothetical protein